MLKSENKHASERFIKFLRCINCIVIEFSKPLSYPQSNKLIFKSFPQARLTIPTIKWFKAGNSQVERNETTYEIKSY